MARMAFAVALVLLTFNPSGYSFYHWLTTPPAGVTAVKATAGVLLLIGWVVCVGTAKVALGLLGMLLGLALFGALAWLLVETGWLSVGDPSSMTWVVLIVLGLVLGVGLSWSLIRARATGQVEVH